MEHAIGEIVTLSDGRKSKVVEGDVCAICCLFGDSCDYLEWHKSLKCCQTDRSDHRDIIYKEIKED